MCISPSAAGTKFLAARIDGQAQNYKNKIRRRPREWITQKYNSLPREDLAAKGNLHARTEKKQPRMR